MSAAKKTLEILDETDALKNIEQYGRDLQRGLSALLNARGIAHSFSGHPSMMGLFFASEAPSNYRSWVNSDYKFYDAMAPELHDLGVLVEPDSREPWFMSAAHDATCLAETLASFEQALDITLQKMPQSGVKELGSE